jgi:hypothetical protein
MAQDYSYDALIEFLKYAGEHGLINASTTRAYRAACSKVEDALTESERGDVRTIDVEVLFQRFMNRNKVGVSPRTLRDYKSRLQKSVSEFKAWRSDPVGYRPKGTPTTPARAGKKKVSREPENSGEAAGVAEHEAPTTPVTKVLNIPYPLREGFTASLQLPRDLTTSEAERLGAFLRTLAIDFEPEK